MSVNVFSWEGVTWEGVTWNVTETEIWNGILVAVVAVVSLVDIDCS